MTKKIYIILTFLTVICFSQDLVDAIVAIIGDEIILQSDVQQMAMMAASQQQVNIMQNEELLNKYMQQSLNSLIDEKIILRQAEIETIEVKDREVEQNLEQRLNMFVSQIGSKKEAEEMYGKPFSKIKQDYRKNIRDGLIVQKLKGMKFQNVTISRREVNDFYESYKDSIPEIPPSYDFSHILIAVEPGKNEVREAVTLADSILKMLRSGADFEELAKKYSADTGTAKFGGDLGFYERGGGFVKEFEETAFSLEPGEISNLTRTEFGYHIIELINRKGEKVHLRHILIDVEKSDKNYNDAYKLADSLHKKLLTKTIDFDSAAVKYSDDAESRINNGHINRLSYTQIEEPAFKNVLDTLEINELSRIFPTEMGYHIIRLNNTHDDTWITLKKWALEYKKMDMYKEWITELHKKFYIEIKDIN